MRAGVHGGRQVCAGYRDRCPWPPYRQPAKFVASRPAARSERGSIARECPDFDREIRAGQLFSEIGTGSTQQILRLSDTPGMTNWRSRRAHRPRPEQRVMQVVDWTTVAFLLEEEAVGPRRSALRAALDCESVFRSSGWGRSACDDEREPISSDDGEPSADEAPWTERAMGGTNDMIADTIWNASQQLLRRQRRVARMLLLRRLAAIALMSLLTVLVAGCKQDNPYFCPEPTPGGCQRFCEDNTHCEGSTTAPACDQTAGVCVQCTADDMTACSGSTPVCLGNACVQCTADDQSACTGNTPRCIDNACVECTEHSQCASNVCAPEGACVDPAEAAYVSETGTNNTECTKLEPCTRVPAALATMRPYVKFTGTIATSETVKVANRSDVTFLADPNTKLTSDTGTAEFALLRVENSHVRVFDLEISGSRGNEGITIFASLLELTRGKVLNNGSYGVRGDDHSSITIRQSKIAGNGNSGINGGTSPFAPFAAEDRLLTVSQSEISNNMWTGITTYHWQFDITNNLIFNNQTAGAPAVQLLNLVGGTQRFDFNTIAGNRNNTSGTGGTNGVTCQGTIVSTFSSNIVYGNTGANGSKQVSECIWAYSNIGPDFVTVPGTRNTNYDPLFVSVAGDFHLMSVSPLKDLADPTATIEFDIDGDRRLVNGSADIGADEISP